MKKITLLLLCGLLSLAGFSQSYNADSAIKAINVKKDSALHVLFKSDSLKVVKQFAEELRDAKAMSVAIYPALKGGPMSGVIPVKDPTEIPDPNMDYKIMFELTQNNPDSLIGEINSSLTEIARIINLHVASGVPLKKIFPVIITHGAALKALTNNAYYKEKYKIDNPNIQLINDLSAMGAKFIACGQAMFFMDMKKEALLPLVKVSLTAQTALSAYALKGYYKYW